MQIKINPLSVCAPRSPIIPSKHTRARAYICRPVGWQAVRGRRTRNNLFGTGKKKNYSSDINQAAQIKPTHIYRPTAARNIAWIIITHTHARAHQGAALRCWFWCKSLTKGINSQTHQGINSLDHTLSGESRLWISHGTAACGMNEGWSFDRRSARNLGVSLKRGENWHVVIFKFCHYGAWAEFNLMLRRSANVTKIQNGF